MSTTVTQQVSQVTVEVGGETTTVAPVTTQVGITVTQQDVTVTQEVNTVLVQSTGLPGPAGPAGPAGSGSITDSTVLAMASKAPSSADALPPNTLTYTDYDGFTSHTKTITYNGSGQPTQTVEVFTYSSQVWTVTKDIDWTGGTPSATLGIVKT